MKRSACGLLLAAIIVSCIEGLSGQAPDKPPQGFFSVLKKDQSVILKKFAGQFEITLMEGVPGPLTHKVIEVETDYVVVEDIAAVSETRIPVYSIKSIVTIKTQKN